MSHSAPLNVSARDDPEYNELSQSRRLSLQPSDLPFTLYFKEKWNCCNCCKKHDGKKGAYDALSSKEEASITLIDPSSHNEKAKEVLVAEQCLDETIKKVVNNLSWVNATLLAVAMKNTLQIDFAGKHSDANNAWVYFFIIFISGIIIAVLPRAFEDINEMKRELELKEICIRKKKEHQDTESETEWNSAKIYDFMEVEANDFVEKFEDLLIPTLSNTVSMAWRDAAKATFALIITTASATATAYFFYALFMTTFGIYLVIRIGSVYQQKEKIIKTYLDEFDERFDDANQEKKKLLKFALTKRTIKLTQTVIKFAIAWSWRDCINAFIHAIYGTEGGNVVTQQWGYFITIALFVSVAFSFSDQFHILYPKNASPEEQKLFLEDKSRLIVNDVLYDNFRFVVGMAMFDALMISLESLSGSNISSSVLCLFYWIVAIGGISLSVVGTHYVKKWELRNKIAVKGVAQALFDTIERIYDPECNLHIEGDADFVPMILDTTVFELVDVTVFGLGIAGSMGTTNAIKFTINSITTESGLYDLSNPDSIEAGVWIIWISFLISLSISTIITAYLARMIGAAKAARKKLFDKFKKDDERDERKRTLDDMKEEEEEEYEEDDPNRKRQKFSTKAEDAADDGGR